MNLSEFGTAKYPLRPSALKKLVNCSMQSILELLGDLEDRSNAGAQTGTVTHSAIEAFHREQRDMEAKTVAGLQALKDACKSNPLADEREAEIYFAHYANDPRNQRAEFVRQHTGGIALEMQVSGKLSPHPSDATGQDIIIEGKLDQLRVFNGKLCLMDYKSGRTSAFEMMHIYVYQQAAYMELARQNGYPVDEAYIIRGYKYRERGADLPSPAEAFVAMPFLPKDLPLILDRVKLEVARVRSGDLQFGPGALCSWCPAKGISNCIPIARKRLGI